MKTVVLLLSFSIYLSASLLDFMHIKKANEAYKNKEYEKASKLYSKIDSDEARFNVADTLYRQGKYKEALEIFQSIKDEKLLYKKLHNIGNTYANLHDIDSAIRSYEEALKIEDDEDTRYNLELLKKKKQEQKPKNKKDNQNQNKKEQKNRDNKKEKDNQNQNKNQDKNSENKNQNQKQEDKKSQKKDKKDQNSKQQKELDKNSNHKPPISDMEERKWQKKLNQREINTLMLPLNKKGEKDDEKNPW